MTPPRVLPTTRLIETFHCEGCGKTRLQEVPCRIELEPGSPIVRCRACLDRMITFLRLDLEQSP